MTVVHSARFEGGTICCLKRVRTQDPAVTNGRFLICLQILPAKLEVLSNMIWSGCPSS